MKNYFLCLTIILLINQINAQHLRARPAGSREVLRENTRSRSGTRQPAAAAAAHTNTRQHSRSTTSTTTTSTTTTTTPAPTSAPEDDTGKYFGTYLGSFETKVHDVSGDIFAVDESTIFIKNFKYDGMGPDAYFWAGTSTDQPDENGFIIPDEKGSTKPLAKYSGQNLVLRLPEGRTLRDLSYIAVWCKKVAANFGHLELKSSKSATIPTAIEIRPLSQLEHGVKSGPINIIDAQTFLITDFHYDGEGPAGYWWASKGDKQNPQGQKIPDENGSLKPLRRYGGETVVITLPDNKTIYDYDYFGVWCEEYFVDFGHTRIPHNILVPPSAKMLGVKHEVLYGDLYNDQETTTITITTSTSTTTTTAAPIIHRQPVNNNLSINRGIVESSRLGLINNRGRPPQRKPSLDSRPSQRKPSLDNRPLDRFEHRRPLVPIGNSINNTPTRENAIHRHTNRTPNNSLANNNNLQPISNSLVGSSKPIVPISNSISAAPNNSPINSLISNPISSSIPVNHLAPANSFIPINNNLPFDKTSLNNFILAHNNLTSNLVATNPITNNQIGVNNAINTNSISNSISSPNSIANINVNNIPISNSIANANSIPNAINKPVVRGRQNAGILEFQTKPERTHSVRPRPERIHPSAEHLNTNSRSEHRSRANSRSQSRANRVTTESTVVAKELNSIDEPNVSGSIGGSSGFGQRLG